MNLAREAYEAYATSTKWKSLVSGQPLPQWDSLSPEIQKAWGVSTAWIVGKLSGNHDWQIPTKDGLQELIDAAKDIRDNPGTDCHGSVGFCAIELPKLARLRDALVLLDSSR